MINDINELAENPAVVLEAMLDGLERSDKWADFEVDMYSFGNIYPDYNTDDGKPICFGCAATCALQLLTGERLDAYSIKECSDRAKRYIIDESTLDRIENAIDQARCGSFSRLFDLFGNEDVYLYDNDLYMNNENWREKVPEFRRVIAKMRKNNPEWR